MIWGVNIVVPNNHEILASILDNTCVRSLAANSYSLTGSMVWLSLMFDSRIGTTRSCRAAYDNRSPQPGLLHQNPI
jgi:hypothetical protein